MKSKKKSGADGGPRRRRPAVESRAALIAAASRLMAKGHTLTTATIAEQAGLAQPTFYAYFRGGVEACRLAVVQNAVQRLEQAAVDRRANAGGSPADFEAQVRALVSWLESAKEHGDIHSIYARYADEASVVGETLRALGESNLARISEDMWRAATVRGVTAEHYPEFRVLAMTFNAGVAALARAVYRGQLLDIERAARATMRAQWGGFGALVLACGGSFQRTSGWPPESA